MKPHELRKRYSEFVLENKDRAMLPAKPLNRKNGQEPSEEFKTEDLNGSRMSLN